MSHHDIFFCHTPRQVDNNSPSFLSGVIVSYDNPPLADLPAIQAQLTTIQAQLDALTVATDQQEDDVDQDEEDADQGEDVADQDDDAVDQDDDAEQDIPAAEVGDENKNDIIVDQTDGLETEEPEQV
ncbi:hypothetical protein BGZ47_008756 [Haplosporangium gracile]|nr:hypothetical protein BGZ47_008756 [Haplosporangium gracile]